MIFKSFVDTFPYCSYGLAFGNVYPNTSKGHARKRALLIILIVGFSGFQLFWFATYTVNCLLQMDIFNFVRNITLWIVVWQFFFKTIYAVKYTKDFAAILNTIISDYEKGNHMDEESQYIYSYYIKKCKVGEIVWTVIPIVFSSQFPIYAAGCTIYETMQSDLGKRYMVHEMDMVFVEDIQYTTPFFEIYFAYNIFQCMAVAPIFIGFDGSFCIATTHLCLKLKLMTHKLNKAFKEARDNHQLRKKIKDVVEDHQVALRYYKALNEFYGPWLLTIFFMASFSVAFCLYQMHIVHRIDPKHTIFMLSFVLHFYVPCVYASNVTKVCDEVTWDLYCVPWEVTHDPVITKTITYMIARAQQPMVLSGKGVVFFNMPLFISLMQSSYSFYTLITS